MEWIAENFIQIFAVVGGLYGIARAIVFLTPTPVDDVYVQKIGIVLKLIGKIAGLDLKQGLNDKTVKKIKKGETK